MMPSGESVRPDTPRVAIAKARQISVGIVGAGLAGLRCADVLLQYGCKVTILEARDRLGGRVACSNHLGHLVDLGPDWLYCLESNPILDIARNSGTQSQAWDEGFCIYDSNGRLLLSDEETGEYNKYLWDRGDPGQIAHAFELSNGHGDFLDPGKSLYDFLVHQADLLFHPEMSLMARRKYETFLKLASTWASCTGGRVQMQSLRFSCFEERFVGRKLFMAGTHQNILDIVAATAKRRASIKIGTEVVQLRGGQPHNTVAELDTADGSTLQFDEVVVTTPLGWLKNNKSSFSPPLPPRLSSAIDNISYGTLDKVYVTFPSAFWQTQGGSSGRSSMASTDPAGTTLDIKATCTPLRKRLERSNKQNCPPGSIHWLEPDYAASTNPEKWFQDGVNMAALHPDFAQPTLLFYIHGAQSRHIASIVQSAMSEAKRDKKLKAFFEPYYSLLPNYDNAKHECQPKGFLATCWCNDKFAGYGSFANFQVGLERGDEDIEVMRHGMPERHIWLAGEHTAPELAVGTTTGAYWSGEAVAYRIVEAYKLEFGLRGDAARM